jgi:putative transcriptional regulator
MIRLKLSALMGERKLRISDVMRDTGISRNALTRIYREEVDRLDLEILEKLCRYLEVDISDMIEMIQRIEETGMPTGQAVMSILMLPSSPIMLTLPNLI